MLVVLQRPSPFATQSRRIQQVRAAGACRLAGCENWSKQNPVACSYLYMVSRRSDALKSALSITVVGWSHHVLTSNHPEGKGESCGCAPPVPTRHEQMVIGASLGMGTLACELAKLASWYASHAALTAGQLLV